MSSWSRITPVRAGVLVVFLALTAYANSLGNGLAYDDEGILTQNPTVTSGDWQGALGRSWWPQSELGPGLLYRPLTSGSFAAEWKIFGGKPLGFHALSVFVHALVSLLVFALLLALGTPTGALVGGALFAIHPIHTEAVANVVGRAELYAAAFYLAACLLYWQGRAWEGARRILRLLTLGLLYFLSLAGKEIGVTLPGALLLLEMYASRLDGPQATRVFLHGLRREAATWLLLLVALFAYLSARFLVLGSIGGDQVAPIFLVVGPRGRLLTAIAVWFQYARLLFFPFDLASDYDPAVMFPSEGLDLSVALGATCIGILVVIAGRAWRRAPMVTLGIAFFAVAVLPVANLLFSTGTVLAERTLYLPSVGLSFAASGLTAPLLQLRPSVRRYVTICAALAATAFFAKTVARNPAWMSTFVVQQTLNDEHPESWRDFRARAQGLERVGSVPESLRAWDQAVRLAPTNYTLLIQAADLHRRAGNAAQAEAYLRRAVALEPEFPNAYQHLGAHLLRNGLGRAAHSLALEGLARAGNDHELWAIVSEAYVAKADLPAAARAREAAIAAGPPTAADWRRMGELLDAMGKTTLAQEARARAVSLERAGSVPGIEGPG